MKNGGYIVIFVIIAAVIGSIIWYNAKDIDNIESKMTTIDVKKTTVQKDGEDVVVQKKIDVMKSDDIEMDEFDVIDGDIDMNEFDNVDDIIVDEEIKF